MTLAVLTTRTRLEERLILEALERRRVHFEQVDDRSLVWQLGSPAPVRRVGMADAFCPHPGTHAEQLAVAGVSADAVVTAALAVLHR